MKLLNYLEIGHVTGAAMCCSYSVCPGCAGFCSELQFETSDACVTSWNSCPGHSSAIHGALSSGFCCNDFNDNCPMPAGTIAGIVVGTVAGLCAIAGGVLYWRRKRAQSAVSAVTA